MALRSHIRDWNCRQLSRCDWIKFVVVAHIIRNSYTRSASGGRKRSAQKKNLRTEVHTGCWIYHVGVRVLVWRVCYIPTVASRVLYPVIWSSWRKRWLGDSQSQSEYPLHNLNIHKKVTVTQAGRSVTRLQRKEKLCIEMTELHVRSRRESTVYIHKNKSINIISSPSWWTNLHQNGHGVLFLPPPKPLYTWPDQLLDNGTPFKSVEVALLRVSIARSPVLVSVWSGLAKYNILIYRHNQEPLCSQPQQDTKLYCIGKRIDSVG